MKKIFILIASCLLLTSCGTSYEYSKVNYGDGYTMPTLDEEKVTVSFYYNIAKQEINLNSGLYATGTDIALKVDQINKGSKVSKPDIDPVRRNYEFDGWHEYATTDTPFDFENTVINANTIVYAHWKQVQEEEFVEPEYIEPSKIDDSLDSLVNITGVLNMPINGTSVKLATASIARLVKDKVDVTKCLNYKIKTGVTLTASYNESTKVISYQATKDEQNVNGTITVSDNTSNLIVPNSTYETKAKNYEAKAGNIEDHRIMLAGSSSMENWSTSTEDLLPLKTYNHGIGGTTVDQWKDKLNQRLVYPFSPKMVVYYVGVNNIINTSDTPNQIKEYLTQMFDDVHEHLPNTKIYYVLINALPGYMNKLSQINEVNQAALDYEANHDYLTTLDAGQLLLKESGKPNAAFFLTDGLHMSKYGYVLWGGFIKNKLIEDLKAND